MKRYMALYIGSVSAAKKAADPTAGMSGDDLAAGMDAWGQWMSRHADAIVDPGTPLGKTRLVSRDGISAAENAVTGYVIVQAESHERAAEMFRDHPHFSIFPGKGVEVVECLAMPGGPD